MRILALETSGVRGSVALLEGGSVLAQAELPPPKRSAQTLIPGIAEQLAAVGWQPAEIELVAVAQGPGSFTGLRVGLTAAKTLAYAVGAKVLGVDTLAVIARQAPDQAALIWAVMDAQRQQLFCACFRRQPAGELVALQPTQIVGNDQLLAGLSPGTTVIGPGLARLAERIPPQVIIAPAETWTPQAATVGQLAYQEYQAGRRDDLWKLLPEYYRASAAEEKRAGGA